MMTRVLLFCFSLFINGVFGVDVDVKKGDSVTLPVTSEEINGAERLKWSFENKEIAKIDLEINKPAEYPDVGFKDRLYLSREDGSLTINNMRTEDSGEYKLEIRGSGPLKFKTFNVNVFGVFGNVKVMKGEDVTLHVTSEEIKKTEKMTWTFTDKEIANIDVKNQPAKYPDDRFKRRLYLSHEDGSLTIYNIRTEDSGVYKLKIISRGESKYKIFNVTVNDQEIKVSVLKGDSFTLPTGVHKQKDDVIEWKINDTILTDGRFTNNGDLIITNIKHDQTGKYDVKINGRNLILQKTFRVNVTDEVKVSAREGVDVTLSINEESHRDDVIEWKFRNNLIAKLDKTNNLIDKPDTRQDVNWVGSLIILNVMTEDSGVYDVHIVSSAHIINKRFHLTVTDYTRLVIIFSSVAAAAAAVGIVGIIYLIIKKRTNLVSLYNIRRQRNNL